MTQINREALAEIQTRATEDGTQDLAVRDYSPSVEIVLRNRMLRMSDVMRHVGRFDPSRVTLHQMEAMRKDTTVQLGLQFKKTPLINAPWHVDCEDKQVAAAMDQALRPIYAGLLSRMLLCLDFGFVPLVKRFKLADWSGLTYEDGQGNPKKLWTSKDVRAVTLDDFKVVPVKGSEPRFKADEQTFDGFTNRGITIAGSDKPLEVPASHALWVTHMKAEEQEDWFGFPLTGFGLRYWWSYWFRWLLADRHMENDADPPLEVGYPPNTLVPDPSDDNPDPAARRQIPAQQLAMMIGESVRNGATIAKPTDTYLDLEQKPMGSPKWTLNFLRGGENMQVFNESFAYLDSMKFASCLLPPAILNQVASASASNDVASDLGVFYAAHSAVIMQVVDQHINDFILPDLAAQNFIDPPPVRKVTEPFRKQDMTAVAQLLTIIAQQDPASLDLDVRKLVKMFGLPQIAPQDRPQAGSNFQGNTGQGTFGNTDANQNPDANAGTPDANGVKNNPQATPRGGGAPDTTSDGFQVTGFALEGTDIEGVNPQTPRRHELPETRQFEDPQINAAADEAYHLLNGFLDEIVHGATDRLAGRDGKVTLALAQDAWKPDLHPRWPAGSPGHKGGEFADINLADILNMLTKQPSGTLNMGFLGRGSTRITGVVASRGPGTGVRFDVELRDGKKGRIETPDTSADFANVMERLRQIDAGEHDGKASDAGAPDAKRSEPPAGSTGVAPSQPAAGDQESLAARALRVGKTRREWDPELQAMVDAARNDPSLAAWPPARGEKAEAVLGPFKDTLEKWSTSVDPDTEEPVWLPERKALHDRIIERFLTGGFTDPSGTEHPAVKRHPEGAVALLTAGGPASGKSSGGLRLEDAVVIDADAIKAMLPEWDMLQGKKGPDGKWIDPPDRSIAFATHEESSWIAHHIQAEAMKRKCNMLIDGTGDTEGSKFKEKVDLLKDEGYETHIALTDVPVDEAFARAVARAHQTGRYLSWTMLVGKHEQVILNHLGWRSDPKVDSWEMYSSDVPKGAEKILIARGGKGSFEVLEQELYDRTLNKAAGDHGPTVDRPEIPRPGGMFSDIGPATGNAAVPLPSQGMTGIRASAPFDVSMAWQGLRVTRSSGSAAETLTVVRVNGDGSVDCTDEAGHPVHLRAGTHVRNVDRRTLSGATA